MANVIGPIENPGAYEVFKIGNYRLPGAVRVMPITKKYKTQMKKASGDDGGTLVLRGMDTVNLEIEMEFFTDQQLSDWQDIRPQIFNEENPSLQNRKLLSHPACSNAKIETGVVTGVTDTPPLAGSNYKVRLTIMAFSRRTGTTHTPKPANTSIVKENAFANAGKPVDPRDAAGRPSQKGLTRILGGTGIIVLPQRNNP